MIAQARQTTDAPREGGTSSGQPFFERELAPSERPRPGEHGLEVKVMWGPIVLDTRQIGEDELVTIGADARATFQLGADQLPGGAHTLVSPGGPAGHRIHAGPGMDVALRRDGRICEPAEMQVSGSVRTLPLHLGERARVSLGQLAFVIQHTAATRGLKSSRLATADPQMGKWWSIFFILAAGLWVVADLTPLAGRNDGDYLANPARFANLIAPVGPKDKKTFDAIKKKVEPKALVEDDKWKKVEATPQTKKTEARPRQARADRDRKIATNAGILALLKEQGGGNGGEGNNAFGGASTVSLDETLDGLRRSGLDSSGFAGLGTRGGPGGGGDIGLGGTGRGPWGPGGGPGHDQVRIGHRGKAKLDMPRTRTKIIGGLSQDVVGTYIERRWSQFKYCYERELSRSPNLYGKLTATFTIAGNGRVSESLVLQSSLQNNNVEQCVLRTIRHITFPPPRGGGEVIVTYPFLFHSAGD